MKSLLGKILSEEGKFICKNNFLTPRKIKDILSEKLTIRVIDMSSGHIEFQIIRFMRLYAAPFVWFHPTVEIEFKNDSGELLYGEFPYKFVWPDYLLLLIPLFFAVFMVPESIAFKLLFFLVAFLFFGSLIYIDTRFVKRQIRKLLENA